MTRDETEARAEFTERYAATHTDLHRRIERAVIGADFGANGYTTLDQANRLAELLQLDATSRLLDLGAGRGWPGVHLAVQTGCQVVLTDMPLEGLRHALARGATEGLGGKVQAVAASAGAPPFSPGTFNAVVHTDVIC